MKSYDVFISFSGADRATVGRIAARLREAKLEVFVDEQILAGEGISSSLEAALRSSKILVAYYSRSYAGRSACQRELTAAFLAGQREGDATQRIVVINPEPGVDHLRPIELADTKFVIVPETTGRLDTTELVATLRRKLAATSGTFTGIDFSFRPRWIRQGVAETQGFVGRYAEAWDIHSALHASDYALLGDDKPGAVVALVGVAGSGKTSLTAAYASRFGAAFEGGVHWTSLSGAKESDVMVRWGDELYRVACHLRPDLARGLGPETTDRTALTALIADHLFVRDVPALWVVDDVPPDLPPELIRDLVLPAVPKLRTILTSRRGLYQHLMPTVQVGGLSDEDAHLLLRSFREPGQDDDARALEALAERLGGHAFSLSLAGRQLGNRAGGVSYGDFLDRLAADPSPLEPALDLVKDALGRLGPSKRLALQVAAVCAPTPLPTTVFRRIFTTLGPDAAGEPERALTGLADLGLASGHGDAWQCHAIVLEAARRYLAPVVATGRVRQVAAEQVLAAMAGQGREVDLLAAHAAALSEQADLPPRTTEGLRRRLVDYYSDRGEAQVAARIWDRLLSGAPAGAADLLAAARMQLAAAEYERAATLAADAARSLTGDDRAEAVATVAQALDALGRLDQADPYWSQLTLTQPDGLSPRRAALELAVIRGRRLRGETRQARQGVDTLLRWLRATPDPELIDLQQVALLELGQIQVFTNAQREARQTAEQVIRHYDNCGLPGHSQALAAQMLLHQAWLTLHLRELNPDPAKWREAAAALNDLRNQLRRSHGQLHAQTLAADVEYGFALLCLGMAASAAEHLRSTIDRLRQRFVSGHPMTLRATLLLGRSYAQQHEYERARELHERAYEGLTTSVGPYHPDTLHAQYGLGVALILTGDRRKGTAMLGAVRAAASRSVGRDSDLYMQSLAAAPLALLPSAVWRLVDRRTGH